MSSPRPDASMSLLHDIAATSLDPGYAAAHEAGDPRPSRPLLLLALTLTGLLFGVAIISDSRDAPQAARDREALIAQVKDLKRTNEDLRSTLGSREDQVDQLRLEALDSSSSPASSLRLTGAMTGVGAVTGPGIVVVVDDAPRGGEARVVDQDLRLLVNGLREAGAEAVAINGHRLSARTAIRGAGSAITVDYASLTRPYRVEAIGDRRRLAAALATTSGGQWWIYLKTNYAMRYELSEATSLTLPADPGLGLSHARRPR